MNWKKERRMGPAPRRCAALLLALAMVFSLLPPAGNSAHAADWMEPYLEKLVEWGVMRGDASGNLYPDRKITRAEFVAMVNRAYGYKEVGENPFLDVPSRAWYAEDVSIAHHTGYFAGTSPTTASPERNLSRQEAALLIGRNMMLQPGVGEVIEFTDGRQIANWSSGMIQAITKAGVIGGYPDGSFQPLKEVTRGEIAVMLVRAIGDPIQEPGTYNMGSVYGNVTITSPGVTLRDTVIAGDLYLTGGIGLGDVLLENVTVLGKIIASGGGESHKGDSSIVLRNVSADELVVDSFEDRFVSLRAEGDTQIGKTSVRTNAYVEDATRDGFGLEYIELQGDPGAIFHLSGNIKEVVNMTPESELVIGKEKADKVTIDEKAVDSTVIIENGAYVEELNLDTGTEVTGEGDIGHLNVNAPGSKVDMLPDTIVIRPGVDADIAGEEMDSVTAEESSADPRILAGFPKMKNIAPTSAEAEFSTNKKGTIYWAVSAKEDGPVGEDELLEPPVYGGKIVKSGKLAMESSNTETRAKVSGLTSGGTYYLSAVFEDARGKRSAVKSITFTTPDDTVPNFAPGYPYMSKITNDSAQVAVMPTKSCQLYYALLPKGSTAPKPADFKTNNVSGNLGYGSMPVKQNVVETFQVNREQLKELVTYDLYLWLTDFDGAKSSQVKKITFTTADRTPPVILHMDMTASKATSVELTYALNEPGNLFWALVKEGEDYPKPVNGQTEKPDLADNAAKIQVESGMNALKNGKSTAKKAQTDVKFTISGLTAQTAYDLYYVAKDDAGNYSEAVKVMTVNTKDDQAPTVEQEFTRYNGNDKDAPLADTDIRLVFSESVQGVETVQGKRVYTPFLPLYQAVQTTTGAEQEKAKEALGAELAKHIALYGVSDAGQAEKVPAAPDRDWVIDYREAVITMEEGKMVITFPSDTALHLASGGTYHFRISGVADASTAANLMGDIQLPDFTTVFAQVVLGVGKEKELSAEQLLDPNDPNLRDGKLRVDMGFTMDPVGTGRVAPSTLWDALLWTDTSMTYSLYSKGESEQKWTKEGTVSVNVAGSPDGKVYSSLARHFKANSGRPNFPPLREMEPREYAVHVERIGDSSDYTAWNCRVTLRVMVVAGSNFALDNLSNGSYTADWETSRRDDGTASIGVKDPFELKKLFTDSVAPKFIDNFPVIKAGDTAAEIEVMIDRPGRVYYVAVPLDKLEYDGAGTELENITNYICAVQPSILDKDTGEKRKPLPVEVPVSGEDPLAPLELVSPGVNTITGGKFTGTVRYGKTGSMEAGNSATLRLDNLTPGSIYYVYMVTQGTSAVYSQYALCYRFTTEVAARPVIELDIDNPYVNVQVDRASFVSYLLVSANRGIFNLDEPFNTVADPGTPEQYLAPGYTVLDALSNDYIVNGKLRGSIFDAYATESAKNKMSNSIRNREPDGSAVTMKAVDVAMPQGPYPPVDCSKGLVGDGYYIFLAVGRSQMGSSDAFRAIRPVQREDKEPPKIVECTTSVIGGGEKDYALAAKKAYTGSLTVMFDEFLYYQMQQGQDQKRLPIQRTKDDPNFNWNTSAYVPLGRLLDLPVLGKVEISNEKPGQKMNVMQFSFSSMLVGSGITIGEGLCDEGGATRGALSLQLDLQKNKEGYWVPYFKIAPKEWDATTPSK